MRLVFFSCLRYNGGIRFSSTGTAGVQKGRFVMTRKLVSLLLALLMASVMAVSAAAATLQSNQAVYHLSQDPSGSQPFSFSASESHSATLVPLGTVIRSDSGGQLSIERFVQKGNYWVSDNTTSAQSQLTVSDAGYIYRISTLDAEGNPVDRGIWVRGNGNPTYATITGEPVDQWAADLVNEAISAQLMPSLLKGKDLRNSISRLQFAALAVQLYETTTGQTVSVPQENPFSDTSDPQALKAYALGVTSGTGNGCFSPSRTITREQAAVMLCAVYRAAGGTISAPSTDRFTDHSSISSWARDSVYFLSHQGVLAGTGEGRFSPQNTAQRQACLIMSLRMSQTLLKPQA